MLKPFGPYLNYRAFLRALPTFCWQTYKEIVTLSEMINEDIDPCIVTQELCLLARSGEIDRCIDNTDYKDKRRARYKYKGKTTS